VDSVVTEKVIDRFEEDGYRKIKEDRFIYLSKSPPWKLLDPPRPGNPVSPYVTTSKWWNSMSTLTFPLDEVAVL